MLYKIPMKNLKKRIIVLISFKKIIQLLFNVREKFITIILILHVCPLIVKSFLNNYPGLLAQ